MLNRTNAHNNITEANHALPPARHSKNSKRIFRIKPYACNTQENDTSANVELATFLYNEQTGQIQIFLSEIDDKKGCRISIRVRYRILSIEFCYGKHMHLRNEYTMPHIRKTYKFVKYILTSKLWLIYLHFY